jgi:hypothetical protein
MLDFNSLVFGNWAITKDLAKILFETIKQHQPEIIIEFGSGTSTIIFDSFNIPVISFEHLEDFRTKNNLSLKNGAKIINTPLKNYQKYIWYDKKIVQAELEKYKNKKAFVFVDGPPGITCDQARYPAFIEILRYFNQFCLILDDYNREDEKNIVKRWRHITNKIYKTKVDQIEFIELNTMRGAILIRTMHDT